MQKLTFIYKNKNERGTFFLFFAAGLLPLLLVVISLSVDFSIYLRNDQKLQELADQASILALRYLPFEEKAKQAATRFLHSKGVGANIIKIGYAAARPGTHQFNDEFEVSLKQDLPLKMISYILPEVKLETRAISRTRATPKDVLITFDRSFYMASDNLQDELLDHESSSFIRDFAPFEPFVDRQSNILINIAPEDFMTQLCFNPFYSEIKKAAISMYEYFAAAGRNGVGVAVFPGIGSENIRIIRPVLAPQQNAISTIENSGEAFPLQLSESHIDQDYYIYNSARVGASSWCAGAAANELNTELRVPDNYANSDIKKLWISSDSYVNSTDIININGSKISYNKNYQPALTVKEVIWSAVVKNSVANTKAVIDSVLVNLLAGPDIQSQSSSTLRTGLSGTSTKTAIILAGDVPYFHSQRFENSEDSVATSIKSSFENVRPILAQQPSLRIKVIYVVINNPDRLNKLIDMQERVQQLDLLFSEVVKSSVDYKNIKVELIYLENIKTLTEQVITLSLLDNNNKVLAY